MTETPFHLFVREYFNGALFILGAYFFGILVVALVSSYRKARSFRSWRTTANVGGLIGLATFFLGDTMRAGWVWGLLKAFNDGGNRTAWYMWFAEAWWMFALAAVALACIGLLCCIRQLAPKEWGNINAAVALVLTVGALIVSSFINLR